MVRMLIQDEADMIATAVDMIVERAEVVDYIWPMVKTTELIVIR